ncbi:MAG: SDR family oxidoreductase [Dehalococcoidales bacterium]|nr:SDR family oxidoreductase [Dehalococcoidales bacterium]
MTNLMNLQGRVAIVTGSGSPKGIGRAIALSLADAGADVAVCDLRVTGGDFDLEGSAKEIRQLGRRSIAVQADVTNKTDVNNLVKRAVDELGTIDILVNNAGTFGWVPFLEDDTDLLNQMLNVNLRSCYLCSQAACKIMVPRKKGNIINLASVSGMRWVPEQFTYGVAKAGVIQLTRWLGRDLAQHNIRVNAIAPGLIETNMGAHRIDKPAEPVGVFKAEDVIKGPISEKIPLGRLGQPSDIANTVLFLASDASSYITGQTIIVDGGVVLS